MKHRYSLVFIFTLTLLLYLVIFFDFAYGGYDNWKHYLISHHLIRHPELSLDTWGKPLFSVLCAPLSYFGYKGAQLFNVICYAIFVLITRRIYRQLHVAPSWVEIIFILSSPIYFLCATSSLTEPLFALILLLSILLFLESRFILTMLVLSLLPFVRNEGYFMWIPFCLLYLNKRDWWKCTFLGFGTILFALITGITHGDLLYVIRTNHYLNHDGHYGSGDWLHFFRRIGIWLGFPLTLIFVFLALQFRKLTIKKNAHHFLLLSLSTFFIYLFIHVIFWKFGIMGSLGLERVFGGITPIAAIGAYYLYQSLSSKFKPIITVVFIIGTILNISYIIQLLNPFIPDRPAEMRSIASQFLKDHQLNEHHKIHIFDPQVIVDLHLDNYDSAQCSEIKFDTLTHQFHVGDIIYWDTYCDSEAGLPKTFFNQDHYKELFHIIDSSQITYKNQIYEVSLFQKK